VLNQLSTTPWISMGSGRIDQRILDLGTSWRWVVSFTPGRFNPGERAPGAHQIGDCVIPEPVWTTCRGEISEKRNLTRVQWRSIVPNSVEIYQMVWALLRTNECDDTNKCNNCFKTLLEEDQTKKVSNSALREAIVRDRDFLCCKPRHLLSLFKAQTTLLATHKWF
jgi:hypothetical protein